MKKKETDNFEKKILRLEEISDLLESEDTQLEDAIKLFEEGIELSEDCLTTLKNAELKSTKYEILSKVNFPSDIKQLDLTQLKTLCSDIREFLIDTISEVGGHFGGGLGAVELTVALHKVFNTPYDLIVWDTGHQAYPHKILTGRKDALKTIRQINGISGFLKRTESEYDVFGAGHASTSLSAA